MSSHPFPVPYYRSTYSANTHRGFLPFPFQRSLFLFFFFFWHFFFFLTPCCKCQVCTTINTTCVWKHTTYTNQPSQLPPPCPCPMSHAPCPHTHAPCPCHLNLPSQLTHPRSDRDPSFKSTFPVRARPGRPCPCTPALSLFALGLSALPPPFFLPPDYPVALHRHSSTTIVAPFDFLSSIHSFFFLVFLLY